MAFAPDGRTFASSGTTGVTRWDTATGRARAVWAPENDEYVGVGAFSPDGRLFASACLERPSATASVQLRDAANGRVLWRHFSPDHANQGVYSVLFKERGRTIRAILGVATLNKGEVVDINAASGQELARRPFAAPAPRSALAVSADGRLLAIGAPSSVSIWDLETDSELSGWLLPGTGLTVSSCGFSLDGATLGVGLSDGSIQLWEIKNTQLRTTVPGHRGGMVSRGLEFSPDGRLLASSGTPVPRSSLMDFAFRVIGWTLRGTANSPCEVVVVDCDRGETILSIDQVNPSVLLARWPHDGRA